MLSRYYARNCIVNEVDLDTATSFLEENHSQGALSRKNPSTCLGLYHREELVGIAQFGYPRTAAMQRKYSTELLRLAFKKEVRVSGGASKLVSHYKKSYKPADIFTYQDATGELTNVYEACGFTLVSQAKRKDYLVAPKKTLETASRKEALGMGYATRYGPDRTLGTKLGEVLREDGQRKSNREIFLEDLGWHVETTAGDRVYEWINPDITFYTYKITATDSDKYYFGVSHIKMGNASESDCLTDGYFGSGGKPKNGGKFANWKKKHKASLVKEIISLHERKALAYEAEASLVGELWRKDRKCLNSRAGGAGVYTNPYKEKYPLALCEIHGQTRHQGDKCMRCTSKASVRLRSCPVHGDVLHMGSNCMTCRAQGVVKFEDCDKHGETKFKGTHCLKCVAAKGLRLENCNVHGETMHFHEVCCACREAKLRKEEVCTVHGLASFRAGNCERCVSSRAVRMTECPTHGLTKHRGEHCYICLQVDSITTKTCPLHGEAVFQGNTCSRCSAAKHLTEENCPLHGKAWFSSGKCKSCIQEKSVNMKDCPRHGTTKHRGKTCSKCIGERMAHRRFHANAPREGCRFCLE